MGTPNYMAPEQFDDPLKVDHRADIYALGVVFYEMLTRELPRGRFLPPSQKVQVDVRLDDVVLRALEQQPQRRYQQANEVKTDVETISRTAPPPRPTIAPPSNSTFEDQDEALSQVRGPAIGLLVVGALQCLFALAIVLLLLGWIVLPQ
jgi:serine/threonine-protein kinase